MTRPGAALYHRSKYRTNYQATPADGESGQASVYLILMMGIFLLAAVGFAVDLSSIWFHRQAAQSAADASCIAGAMDMLYLSKGTIASSPGFSPGTGGDCSSSSASAICKYAAFNGYTATTSAASWGTSTAAGAIAVSWTFPTSVTGVKSSGGATYPFLAVVVQEKPVTWFMGLLGVNAMTVGASCTCGLPPGTGSPPLVILHPTAAQSLWVSGGAHIAITGGPTISIGVNSTANGSPSSNRSNNAVYCDGGNGYPIDTSTAGPTATGGQLSIVGGPTTNQYCGAQTILNDPANKLWKSPQAATADPYGSVPAPTQPGAPQLLTSNPVGDATGCIQNAVSSGSNGCARKDPTYGLITGVWVGPGTDSCPNTIANSSAGTLHNVGQDPGTYVEYYGNCLEFSPGYYPTGINVTNLAGWANDVTTFQPGVYYLNGNLTVGSSSTIRNAWIGTQPSTQGVIFYFLSGGPVFSGGSGAPNSNISAVPSYYLTCSGTTTPSGMPTSLTGNVLASQCSAGGTYVGAPSSDSYSAAGLRGLLFFAGHSTTYNAVLLGAGASLNFTGAFYFHNTSYADYVELDGAGSSTAYAIGNVVVDKLKLSGAGTIKLGLTASSSSGSASVGIFQ
jgi:hypothetical protein